MTPDIVDTHVHAYPAQIAADPAGWGRAHGEEGWLACVAPAGRRSLQGWRDADALVADLDAAGVAGAVLLGWYWERQATCDLQNHWHREWVKRHSERLAGFASVQPSAGAAATDALERALDDGLCGIGELLPSDTRTFLEDPHWARVLEIAHERSLPVTFHATDPAAGPRAGPPTDLARYVQMARAYPNAQFILAHWGGGLAFGGRDASPIPTNLYFDSAASPLLYDAGVFRRAVDGVGAERILFGSDHPLVLYPRLSREPDLARFLREIEEAALTDGERARVLGGNARRVLATALAPVRKRV